MLEEKFNVCEPLVSPCNPIHAVLFSLDELSCVLVKPLLIVVYPASLAIVTKKAEEREKILLKPIKRMVKMSMQCSL